MKKIYSILPFISALVISSSCATTPTKQKPERDFIAELWQKSEDAINSDKPLTVGDVNKIAFADPSTEIKTCYERFGWSFDHMNYLGIYQDQKCCEKPPHDCKQEFLEFKQIVKKIYQAEIDILRLRCKGNYKHSNRYAEFVKNLPLSEGEQIVLIEECSAEYKQNLEYELKKLK